MENRIVTILVAGVVGWVGSALSANEFRVENQTFVLGSTGNIVPVLADVDQPTYAFSVHLTFNSSKIRVTDVSLGSDVSALSPEFFEGAATNSGQGNVVYGVVFDTSDPITKNLPVGDGQEILVLTVDVITDSETTDSLAFQNDTGPPWRRNVMTTASGDSVNSLTLDNGTLTLDSLAPTITSFVSASGEPGQFFFINGTNFLDANLVVRVDGQLATRTIIDEQTVRVAAPACEEAGDADVEVCTDFGCDTFNNGFEYTGGCDDENVPPSIDSFVSNMGPEGTTFFVVGRNFDLPNTSVEVTVDGRQPLAASVVDDQTLRVTSPACLAEGPVEVRVCNDHGCDFVANGYTYTDCDVPPIGVGPFVRGDCNGDGESAGSPTDGIFLLTFLFIGGSVPPCLAACDMDGSGDVEGAPTDALYFFNFNFLGGRAIPPPIVCGNSELAADIALGCADSRGCN